MKELKAFRKYLAEGKLFEEVDYDTPDDDDVTGWYWPIADQAMVILKDKGEDITLGAVGDGDEKTYIEITVDHSGGWEDRYKVYFDQDEKVTNIESD
jgi:hypothetical protein|tara:strand:+ start:19 stop:309 length:291 start_codon:yes stop_codon:yes gene_type:complete